MPQFTLATVLFGGVDVLRETMPTWATAVAGLQQQVLVVDNSPDATAAEVVELHLRAVSSLQVIRRPENVGFAAAVNEIFDTMTTDWVLLVNADVNLTPGALREAQSWVSAPGRDPSRDCAALTLVTGGRTTCGIELDLIGYFSDRRVPSRRPALGPSGGGLLMHRRSFARVGRLDGDLFAWGEDAGLGLRLWAGGVSTHELATPLDHVGGHSVSSLQGQRLKARLLARNRILVLRRDFTAGARVALGPAQILTMALNGLLRKWPAGTAASHFRGMAEGFRAPGRHLPRPRMSLREFLRYRRARTTHVARP